jgi:hypothetical protein
MQGEDFGLIGEIRGRLLGPAFVDANDQRRISLNVRDDARLKGRPNLSLIGLALRMTTL